MNSRFDNDDIYNNLVISGKDKMGSGDLTGAIEDLTKAIDIKQDSEIFVILAQAKMLAEDQQGALELLTKALSMKEDSSYYSKRAEVKVSLGKFQEALADVDKALSMNSENSWGYFVRAQIKKNLEDKKGSMDDINIAVNKSADVGQFGNAVYHIFMARLQSDMGDKKGAISAMNSGIEMFESIEEQSLTEKQMKELYIERASIKKALGD